MTIEWANGWFYIGRAMMYGQCTYAIGLYWNNRALLTGEHPPAGEYMHADHIELLWHGAPPLAWRGRVLDWKWLELRRFKMHWREVQR